LVKSGFDRLSAALLLMLFSPLLAFVAIAVRVTSAGPALFLQTRVGKNGKPFRMVKFRSMVEDAEDQLASLQAYNEVEGGTLFKIKADPRVTRIGRVIRRFSIDEIPQLFNVLTGSMSLVGPRPQLPAEVEQHGGDVRRRLLVKPGMTGLWQISGRSQLTWEESVRIDLRYVENWSLSLDLLVLIKTFGAVVRAKGAY
jgi:lipopolysaccharide/colanic/teichoic acid biosynthesis glycosyltransferase